MSIDDKVNTILKQLRRSPHATTGTSPYKLMFGRNIRTELDLMVEDIHTGHGRNETTTANRAFSVGESVLARNFSSNSNVKWSIGTVKRRLGNVIYLVQVDDGRLWKRHVDQLRKSL